MARSTPNALADVDRVIEIGVVRQIVDAVPLDRCVVLVALSDRFQQVGTLPHLLVAVHAGLRWRNVGEPGRLDGRVAVTTINAELPNVVSVAERNRLRRGLPDAAWRNWSGRTPPTPPRSSPPEAGSPG